jgi:hypothetical protein
MRPIKLALLIAMLHVPNPAVAQAPNADQEAVLAVLNNFTAALLRKDSAGMASQLDSTSRFTLLRPSPNGTRVWVVQPSQFISLTTKPDGPAYDEPIRNPIVHIDGDLATVWAEYQVVLNGAVSHCGYDSFQLARLNGQWKIINVSDTFRRDGCGELWRPTPAH